MYTFRLQAVLDQRQVIEDNLKRELAEIRQQIMLSQKQLESLTMKAIHTATALKKEQAEAFSSDQVVIYHTYLKRLAERITRQQTVINEIQEEESVKQGELIEAMKKRQILEKLKDQGRDRFNQEMLKKEMSFIDEIAVNRFVRKTIQNNGDGQ